jgi:hypothetical protein
MKWTQPVYSAQILTGVAGIGAVLVADNITKWHILVSAILASSVVVSLMVVARAEADADRNRSHLDTLLRAMELPYFIIETISKVVESIARTRGWQLARQENFEQETVYQFQSNDRQFGRLVMAAQEFKDLWILDEAARTKSVERRLFDPEVSISPEAVERYAGAVIREAITKHVKGPHWVSQAVEPDGKRIYELRLDQTALPIKTVVFSKQRFDELLSMIPIRRYQELAEEVDRVFSAP